jgi:uncharacterized protein
MISQSVSSVAPSNGSPATPLDVVRESYAAYERRDLAGVFAHLADDIEIAQTVQLPWGGRFIGHEGAKRFFLLLGQHLETMPEPRAWIPAGDEVAVFGRLKGRARVTGRPIDVDFVHVWTIRGQKAVRFEALVDTPALLEAMRPK